MSNYEDKLWGLKEVGDGTAQPFLATLQQLQEYGVRMQLKCGVEISIKNLNI